MTAVVSIRKYLAHESLTYSGGRTDFAGEDSCWNGNEPHEILTHLKLLWRK